MTIISAYAIACVSECVSSSFLSDLHKISVGRMNARNSGHYTRTYTRYTIRGEREKSVSNSMINTLSLFSPSPFLDCSCATATALAPRSGDVIKKYDDGKLWHFQTTGKRAKKVIPCIRTH